MSHSHTLLSGFIGGLESAWQRPQDVLVWLPRFKLETSMSLKE